MAALAGVGTALLLALGLISVGFTSAGAVPVGLIVGLIVTWTVRKPHSGQQRRPPRLLVIAFYACATGWLASVLVHNSQPGPCNADDLTGCSSLGEAALIAWFLLTPTAAVLALVLGIVFVSRLFRSDH